jgi:hypothetical protein
VKVTGKEENGGLVHAVDISFPNPSIGDGATDNDVEVVVCILDDDDELWVGQPMNGCITPMVVGAPLELEGCPAQS